MTSSRVDGSSGDRRRNVIWVERTSVSFGVAGNRRLPGSISNRRRVRVGRLSHGGDALFQHFSALRHKCKLLQSNGVRMR